jgi:hypothetical protein
MLFSYKILPHEEGQNVRVSFTAFNPPIEVELQLKDPTKAYNAVYDMLWMLLEDMLARRVTISLNTDEDHGTDRGVQIDFRSGLTVLLNNEMVNRGYSNEEFAEYSKAFSVYEVEAMLDINSVAPIENFRKAFLFFGKFVEITDTQVGFDVGTGNHLNVGFHLVPLDMVNPGAPYLTDRADGVTGHYCITRRTPNDMRFVEHWNDGKWTGFGQLFNLKDSKVSSAPPGRSALEKEVDRLNKALEASRAEADDLRRKLLEGPQVPVSESGTALHSTELSELAFGHLSHDEMAGMVRMLMRGDLQHEAVVTGARDRIKWMEWRINQLENGGAGTPSLRLSYMLDELCRRFPKATSIYRSEPPEVALLNALDEVLKSVSIEGIRDKVGTVLAEIGRSVDKVADKNLAQDYRDGSALQKGQRVYTRAEVQAWRDDAFFAASQIAERFTDSNPYMIEALRTMISKDFDDKLPLVDGALFFSYGAIEALKDIVSHYDSFKKYIEDAREHDDDQSRDNMSYYDHELAVLLRMKELSRRYIENTAYGTKKATFPVSQDPKYGISDGVLYVRSTGHAIPSDEPVFILRAKDTLAVSALETYINLLQTRNHGSGAVDVLNRKRDFELFAEQHKNRVKFPDTFIPKAPAEAANGVFFSSETPPWELAELIRSRTMSALTVKQALSVLEYAWPHIDPRAINVRLARTGPMNRAYINTTVRLFLEAAASSFPENRTL